MGQNNKQEKQQTGLQSVSALVPAVVKELVVKLAADEGRSTSQVVRRLLEDSPRVKAELRRQSRATA